MKTTRNLTFRDNSGTGVSNTTNMSFNGCGYVYSLSGFIAATKATSSGSALQGVTNGLPKEFLIKSTLAMGGGWHPY